MLSLDGTVRPGSSIGQAHSKEAAAKGSLQEGRGSGAAPLGDDSKELVPPLKRPNVFLKVVFLP